MRIITVEEHFEHPEVRQHGDTGARVARNY